MAYLNEYYKKMFLDKIAYTSFNIFVEMLFSALFFLKKELHLFERKYF